MRTTWVAALLTGCALAAWAPASRAIARDAPRVPVSAPAADAGASAGAGEIIYLVRRKWHVDVGFAVRDSGPSLAAVAAQFPDARYLFFGFGDRHYLLAKNKSAPNMLRALWPGPGMMLVTSIENSPQQAFGAAQVLKFEVGSIQAQQLQLYISRSLARTGAADEVAPYSQGPYGGSLYYSAVPRYSALYTCNTWAAEALQAAGIPVRTRFVIFTGRLWRSARKLACKGPPCASIAGRRIAVLAYHGGRRAGGYDHGGLLRRRRTRAADTAGQQTGCDHDTH